MFTTFLEKQNNALLVAKIAIIFQSVITFCVSILLVCSIFNVTYPSFILKDLLILDILFVAIHLSYRSLYSGPKVILNAQEKSILIVHVITALTALTLTIILVKNALAVGFLFTWLTLMVWEVSLIFGILFFIKKYVQRRYLV